MTDLEKILNNIDIIIKQISDIRILGEYNDTEYSILVGEKEGVFFVNRNGVMLVTTSDAKKAIATFYAQIASVYEDTKNNANSDFTTLREILLSRNDFVRSKLDELGEGQLSKALSLLDFSGVITESILENEIGRFDTLVKEMHDCEHCNSKPKTYGKGEILDENVFVGNPKPNNSGMMTYSNDFEISTKSLFVNSGDEQISLFKALKPAIEGYFNTGVSDIKISVS